MINFVESYMTDSNKYDDLDADEQKILMHAMKAVLPIIIDKELTQKQSLCLRLFYIHGKSQTEIARQLKLSQPTVSRHISTAKAVVNKIITYCYFSVKKANEQWLKLE